eukprot:44126_1
MYVLYLILSLFKNSFQYDNKCSHDPTVNMNLPIKKQRRSNKLKSWFLPQFVERTVLLLRLKIPLSTLYDQAKLLDEWKMKMDDITDAEYNKIAAPKPSTVRNHIFEIHQHTKNGHQTLALSDPNIIKSWITDKGSTHCRQKEPIRSNCFSYAIDKHIPKEFTNNGITQFNVLYKSSISKVVQDSDDCISNANACKRDIINNNVHGTSLWIADGASNMEAAVKVLRGPSHTEFRDDYDMQWSKS